METRDAAFAIPGRVNYLPDDRRILWLCRPVWNIVPAAALETWYLMEASEAENI